VFLLNSDASPMPGAIARLVDAAQAHPRAAGVAPRIEREDGSLEHSTHPFPSLRVAALTAFAWNRMSRRTANDLFLEGTWMHDRPRRVDWAIGAALLLRKEAVDQIGGFDERFFMYAEDLEWCWRAAKHGWTIRFEPSAVVRHTGNASGEQRFGSRRTREHMRNALLFYWREHGLTSAMAWWGINVTGSYARLAGAAMARDQSRTAYWREHAAAQLAAVTRPR
jgi:GT2 family glycosyltransferase